jgi:phospholipid-binding lipoprotein MlaA
LPFFGPKSLRDTVGFAGDIALSPLFWVSLWFPAAAWLPAISTPDSVRTWHDKLSAYDAATSNSLDRYLALRSAYIQNRQQAASKSK